MNNTQDYNGWSNRSTWLVILHLNNTNEEVYKRWQEIVRDETKDEAIRAIFQLVSYDTEIKKEQEYYPNEIEWSEVYNSLKGID